MTVKEFLNQGYRIDKRINSKLEQIRSLKEMATKATYTFNEIGGSNGTKNTQVMEGVIVQMLDLATEIDNDIAELIEIKKKVMIAVKAVQNPELQTLLELRYLCHKPWEQIADEMGYDLSWLHRLHKKALSNLNKTSH